MENKYYTPTIEEFCVGFEYERMNGDKWCKDIISPNDLCSGRDGLENEFEEIYRKLRDVRVKYLDKEDIESLGFKKSGKNQWVGYEDYFSGNVSGEYGYFLYVTIHYPVLYVKSKRLEDNLFKIIVHRHYVSNEDETSSINYSLDNNESEIVFKGTIKNKHELKRVLTMLGIM